MVGINALLVLLAVTVEAFVPATTTMARPVRLAAEKEKERKGQITAQGLMELITLGLGAPNLGKFKGVDKETGALNFELEANRIYDKNGKEYNSYDNSQNPYFEDAYVDESADVMANIKKFFGGGGGGGDKDEKKK